MKNILRLAMLVVALTLVGKAQTFSEPWATSVNGWTYTQVACGGTCTSGLVTSDGNPADSVNAKITGRSKQMTGYWKKSLTWEAMGVTAGNLVTSVDGSWQDKTVQTLVACTATTTAGIQLFDSANTTELTASAVEPNLNVAGDTATWTSHNPTSTVALSSSSPSSTTVTWRMNVNPDSGNNSSAACETRVDNFQIVITSITPSGRKSQTIVAFKF